MIEIIHIAYSTTYLWLKYDAAIEWPLGKTNNYVRPILKSWHFGKLSVFQDPLNQGIKISNWYATPVKYFIIIFP